MRFNTGNPVEPDGSSDPRDLYDNAGIADLLINGPLGEYLSRLGVPLKSWRGIMQQVTDYLIAQGYESIYLTYGAGVVVERQTQLVQREGELYRVMNASDIPLTLTGTWATDAPKLQAVGDAALRLALALVSGAGKVGFDQGETYAATTVGFELKRLNEEVLEADWEFRESPYVRSFDRRSIALRNTYNSWLSPSSVTGARTVNILGDSISFGAGAGAGGVTGAVSDNAWVRILQRILNIENGGNNYGFVSPYEGTTGTEVHTVTQIPAVPGQFWGALSDAAASHLPNGWAITSSQAGDALRFTLVSEFTQLKVWYDGTKTGSFRVALGNGTVLATVTTTGDGTGLESTVALNLADWSIGTTRIDITVLSGAVAISGLSYGFNLANFSVNNFSRDGRRLQFVSENVIEKLCAGAGSLVLALGVNDRNASGSDRTAVIQRIDWAIQYATQYQCRLVIVDMLFRDPETHWLREEFLRAAAETPGAVLVPLPSLFSPSGVPLTTAQLNERNITYDGIHPTQQGHRMIAETVARLMGLSVTSKGMADRMTSKWVALALQNGVVNNTGSVTAITSYKRCGSTLEVRFNCTCPASGTLVAQIPLKFVNVASAARYALNPQADGKAALIDVSATGELRVYSDPGRSQGLPTFLVGCISIPLRVDSEFNPYW